MEILLSANELRTMGERGTLENNLKTVWNEQLRNATRENRTKCVLLLPDDIAYLLGWTPGYIEDIFGDLGFKWDLKSKDTHYEITVYWEGDEE